MKARNIGLLLMIAAGLYACGGGSSDNMMSSTPPSSSAPPPAAPVPPPLDSVTVQTVDFLVSAQADTADPLLLADGAVLTPSNDEASDPMVVDGP